MPGLTPDTPIPEELSMLPEKGMLRVVYSDTEKYELPYEYLRVYSPSAEVRGHGAGQEVLQTGKKHVSLDNAELVGQYAVKLVYSDGHDSGLYSWDYLYDLCLHHAEYWQDYLDRLAQAGASRD